MTLADLLPSVGLAGEPPSTQRCGRSLRHAVPGARRGRRPPRLTVEPGRSLVATAGITVYRVIGVKRTARTFVAVDGGMSDNPRPALYGARYTARLLGRHSTAPRRPFTLVGRHCEAGDLLAVPVTGAYHQSLASNYNLTCGPPLVVVTNGTTRLLIPRETEEDLLRRT